jgi:hypothetical protein
MGDSDLSIAVLVLADVREIVFERSDGDGDGCWDRDGGDRLGGTGLAAGLMTGGCSGSGTSFGAI